MYEDVYFLSFVKTSEKVGILSSSYYIANVVDKRYLK
mgnify:CR=1 FL=1